MHQLNASVRKSRGRAWGGDACPRTVHGLGGSLEVPTQLESGFLLVLLESGRTPLTRCSSPK